MTEEERKAQDKAIKDAAEAAAKVAAEAAVKQYVDADKGKLDGAFKERDEAKAEAARVQKELDELKEKAAAQAEKERKALEDRLAKLDEKDAARQKELDAMKVQNRDLVRDREIASALDGREFANQRARDIAIGQIAQSLSHDETADAWQDTEGNSVADTVKAFAEADDNAFLFKSETESRGSRTTPSANARQTDEPELPENFNDMSEDDVLSGIESGKLETGIWDDAAERLAA